MATIVRKSIFETNSSSTHSLSIEHVNYSVLTEEQYNDFKEENIFLDSNLEICNSCSFGCYRFRDIDDSAYSNGDDSSNYALLISISEIKIDSKKYYIVNKIEGESNYDQNC